MSDNNDLEYADLSNVEVPFPEGSQDAVASVFANPEDIRRYHEAKAAGASESEALSVGDNGRGAFGADTTSTNIPMVALPPDTPGFAPGKKVIVYGPKGTVLASVEDKMPSYSKLKGEGSIDLNPAAALLTGHPGGVTPVKWKWADEADIKEPAATLAGARVPDQFSAKLAQDIAGGPQMASSDTDVGLSPDAMDEGMDTGEAADVTPTESTPQENPTVVDVAPPHPETGKFIGYDEQGGKMLSNKVTVYPDNSIKFQIGDRMFYKSPYGRTIDITPKGGSPDEVLAKKAAEKGVIRSDFKTDEEFRSAAKDAVSGADTGKAIADAIASGTQPPVLTGMYRYGAAVRKALQEKGYDLTKANLEWQAMTRHMATMNSSQQVAITQNLSFLDDATKKVDDLVSTWNAGKFPILNKARLVAAKNGALGPEAQSIATQLDGQIQDTVAALSKVYMGAASPTSKSMELAAANLQSDWSAKTLHDMTNLIRTNAGYRRNAILASPVMGPNGPIAQTTTATAPPPPAANEVTRVTKDGRKAVFDATTKQFLRYAE